MASALRVLLFYIFRDLVQKSLPLLEPPPPGLDEPSYLPFRLRCRRAAAAASTNARPNLDVSYTASLADADYFRS